MATIEDLERRLAELERWRDNEQRQMLQLLLTTQSEQTATLAQHTNALATLERELGSVRSEVRTGFAMLANLIDPQNESGPET